MSRGRPSIEKVPVPNLRKARIQEGWSQMELASKSEVSIKVISDAENDKGVSPAILKRLAKTLKMKVGDLQ